ncbi:DUF2897 family protein [Vibrio sp.]|nr:DUF2897 family protein [Vibrio sp.]
MIDILTSPWFIIIAVVGVIIGNIALLKHTANMGQSKTDTIDKLTKLEKENREKINKNK